MQNKPILTQFAVILIFSISFSISLKFFRPNTSNCNDSLLIIWVKKKCYQQMAHHILLFAINHFDYWSHLNWKYRTRSACSSIQCVINSKIYFKKTWRRQTTILNQIRKCHDKNHVWIHLISVCITVICHFGWPLCCLYTVVVARNTIYF